jgi:WD40 repeat protein
MSRSLKVRQDCIYGVKLALRRNGFPSQRSLAEDAGFALATVSNFLTGKPVDFATFEEISRRLALDWREISSLDVEIASQSVNRNPETSNSNQITSPGGPGVTAPLGSPFYLERASIEERIDELRSTSQDWGESIDLSEFYGRAQELTFLEQWIVEDRCKLLAIIGMGGIGKTTLTVKLAKHLQGQFGFVIWRSLRDAPPLDRILTDLIHFLSGHTEVELPEYSEAKIARLIHYLNQHRCLLILDNAEALFQSYAPAGNYKLGYEDYGILLKSIGQAQHQSCLILTSREKPKEISRLETSDQSVRAFSLKGLTLAEGKTIFCRRQCSGITDTEWKSLFEHYAGNPLALQIVAAAVQDLYEGEMAEIMPFLQQGNLHLENINDLLSEHFERLSSYEQSVMYWLAINREPFTISDLNTDIIPLHRQYLLNSVQTLTHKSLIEKSEKKLFLQPVVIEYVTNRLIEKACQEIVSLTPEVLQNHALLKAQSKDYIRQAQTQLILRPLLERLSIELGHGVNLDQRLREILSKQQRDVPLQPGYVGGNILNLLLEIQTDLNNLDCSHLVIWQAHLVGKNLQNVNFSYSDLSKSSFNDTQNATLSVLYSPDGQTFAAGNADNKIRIWRVADYQEHLILEGHASWVWTVAFSPNNQILGSGSLDQTLKLWDLSTGQCLKTFEGHLGWVWSIAFSPDGTMLASGSNDRTVKIWDIASGQCLRTLEDHNAPVWTVRFNQNGSILATGGDDCTIKLWNTKTWELIKTLEGHSDWVRSVVILPDGLTLASGSSDRTIKLWSIPTGECLKTFNGHQHSVNSIDVIVDPETSQVLLISGSQDQTVRIWDARDGDCLKTLLGHSRGIWTVALHPKGKTFASGGHDSSIRLWDVKSGYSLKTLQGYSAGIKTLHYSSSTHTLASGGDEGIIKLWDLQTGSCINALFGHSGWIWCLEFSSDNKILASAGNDGIIRLWNIEKGTLQQTLRGHTNIIFSIAFSPDGQYLASACADSSSRIWKIDTGKCIDILPHFGRIASVSFSPDSRFVASASESPSVKLWSIQSGDIVREFRGESTTVHSIAFSSDGSVLAIGNGDCTIQLWETHSGKLLHTMKGHTFTIWSIAFNQESKTIVSASFDGTVRVWDILTGHCLHVLRGHAGEVWSAFFHPSRFGFVVSSGQDGTIRVWDVEKEVCSSILTTPRCYEGMNISGATGLSDVQKRNLLFLGAIR